MSGRNHASSGVAATAGIAGITLLGMTAMGIALPILPQRLNGDAGYSLTFVGWIIGLESIATLLSRPWCGHLTDRRGGQFAVVAGLVAMMFCGLAYTVSDFFLDAGVAGRRAATGLIVSGRIFMGIGEGLVISGTGLWAVDRAGPERVGRAVSWVGLGLFAGLALGSVFGAWLDHGQPGGFRLACVVSMLIPLVGIGVSFFIRPGSVTHHHDAAPIGPLLAVILLPGLGLFANACGFAAITSFLALDYEAHGWGVLPLGSAGTGIAGFGVGHVAARVLFSDLSDRVRSRWPAVMCLVVEALGLCVIWLAPTPVMALAGTVVTGFGFSMGYPLLNLPVLATVPAARRGMAFALFDAFFDSGAGIAALCSGTVARYFSLPGVFLVAALAALAGIVPLLMVPAARWRRETPEA
ncbi:MFS transporter [Acetobacter oeni]|uniref:MFS transporter n=1 Tax=Acetobacter oeni TaxID=304077 RepID=A0A511XNT4_9PROT|nr:MFS transporter [Acetobacter oeni]MBB3881625.1 MFS family permease [Acetobacter oeni]NHO17565.1 MFS transporter [Acetobacter oeni]GBR00945.1 major facilitator superfamily transporter [Acetobacter oeni LMG 21952]GEN64620.1 MFS transporter [Acetobacter oeni]